MWNYLLPMILATSSVQNVQELTVPLFGAYTFPNPCTTSCTIRLVNLQRRLNKDGKLEVLSIDGTVIEDLRPRVTAAANSEQQDLTLDLSGHPNGVYVIAAQSTHGIEVWKFVKNGQ